MRSPGRKSSPHNNRGHSGKEKGSKRVVDKRRSRLSIALLLVGLWALLLVKAPTWMPAGEVDAQSANGDIAFDMEDMDFILEQIKIAERHAAGEELLDILPNATMPLGLRTVDGSFNNLIPGQEHFGQADLPFPTSVDRDYRDAQNGTSYADDIGPADIVQDSTPRLISHLIVNQSVSNPAAVFAAGENEDSENSGPDITGIDQLFIPNVAVDEGLSAPTNAFITFFGQFFDHGLDLINKGGNGTVFIPLQPDDPLFNPAPGAPNFMMMTRATRDPGPDGVLGTDDDEFTNATTPHVDQQQTYASHASAQVLLRHYDVNGGVLQNSGHLLDGFGNDGMLDTPDDGGLATWDTVQLQALQKFGIVLDDMDGYNMPMIAADQYGNFIPGPARGLPQLVTAGGPVEGDLAAPVDATQAVRINHSFFLDVAHTANPVGQAGPLPADDDSVINPRTDMLSGQTVRGIREAGTAGEAPAYDDELLGVHFTCGDGRCNENIALTTVHHVFHAEHNRLVDVAKRVVLDTGDLARLNEWLDAPLEAFPAWTPLPFPVSDASQANQAATHAAIEALGLDWNGDRVFQAARFGTEMQYNRIVFDEFSPTLAGLKDVFEGYHTNLDPTITAEFSQSVYRFGHSMLTSTVDRFDPDFNTITDPATGTNHQFGLFEAFLNPLAFYNYDDATGQYTMTPEEGAGAVVRGITRTRGNEIDEFVDGALQNNLVGLPLDLGAINIARGRDVGNPRLNDARRMFFAQTSDTRLMPYMSWADYADNLRHEPSLVNFIAAYGTHPTVAGADGIVGNADDPVTSFADRRAAACAIASSIAGDPAGFCADNGFGTTTIPGDAVDFMFSSGAWSNVGGRAITGLEDVDFWNGGLAEERMPFGGYLGSTHNFVFETQMEVLQNGDRFYYVGRTANIHFFSELESNSFTSLVMRNTDMGEQGGGVLPLNIFAVQNHYLEVDQSEQFNGSGVDDPEDEEQLTPLVIRDPTQTTTNIWVPDATRFVQYTGGDHVSMNGTPGPDTIIGGIGDDSIYGREGDDRIEGGDGADLIEGGPGDDIITDLSGPDVIEGGEGNDAIFSGNEEDVIFGDAGNDFIVNPSELGEIFAGLGDDFIFDGYHLGHIRGGGGDDWMENLGGGEDLWQGDDGAAAEGGEPRVKGNDVGIAHGGNNDFDMENGDDIVVDGPGIERAEGQLGFDWISFQNDRFGVSIDLDLTIFLRPTLPPSNDTVLNRYDRVEGATGSAFADILRAPRKVTATATSSSTSACSTASTPSCLSPSVGIFLPSPLTGEAQFGWTGGEILLGGAGSDMLVGEGGNDIIDGDSALTVMISTPDPEIRMGPLGQALRSAKAAANAATSQAAADQAAADSGEAARAAAAAAAAAAADALAAANLALQAAEDAEAAAQLAVDNPGGQMTVMDSLNNLLATADLVTTPVNTTGSLDAAWQDFLDSCNTALGSMMALDVSLETASDSAAAALAVQVNATAAVAAAAEAEAAAIQATLDAAAAASAALAVTAQADLDAAQAAMDAADQMILVPGMQHLMAAVFGGFINPGELAISRVIADNDPSNADTDVVSYAGNFIDYTVAAGPGDFIEITDNRVLPLNADGGNEGRDLVRNIERIQFADLAVTIGPENNSPAQGAPTVSGVPSVGGTLTASTDGITDADNVSSGGLIPATTAVDWRWQVELDPGTGVFTPILRNAGGDDFEASGANFVVSADELGLLVRVVAIFQDEALVFETATSSAVLIDGTLPVGNVAPVVPAVVTLPAITEGGTLAFGEADILAAGVSDPNGDALTFNVSPLSDNGGTVEPASDGFIFTPAEGFTGTDTITFSVSDGQFTVPGSLSVDVGAVTPPPPTATVSIDRARCRTGRRLRVDGTTTGVLNGTATVVGWGTAPVAAGVFEFRANANTCPASVTVELRRGFRHFGSEHP